MALIFGWKPKLKEIAEAETNLIFMETKDFGLIKKLVNEELLAKNQMMLI
jgi:hypothetical protein